MSVIESTPDIMGGTPVFRGTRVPLETLLDYLKAGDSTEDFLADFPTVSQQQVILALEQMGESLAGRGTVVKILLDECLPKRLAAHLPGHEALTVPQAGWASIKNGKLLKLAEREFDAFVTVDRNLTFQQNVAELRIAVVVLVSKSNRFEDLLPLAPRILQVLETIQRGEIRLVGAADPA